METGERTGTGKEEAHTGTVRVYLFGGLKFRLTGEVPDCILDEFSGYQQLEGLSDYDFTLNFRPGFLGPAPSDHRHIIVSRGIRLAVNSMDDVDIWFSAKRATWLMNRLRVNRLRFLNPYNQDQKEYLAAYFCRSFLNGLFLPFLLHQGFSYLHCSGVEWKGHKLIFPSHGGAGKTTLQNKMVFAKGAKYLCDDFLIVGKDAVVHPSYLPTHIYAYNIKHFLALEEKVFRNKTLDWAKFRFWSALRAADRVRRRKHIRELYPPETIAEPGKVHASFYLRRSSQAEKVELRELSVEEAVRRNLNILFYEITQYHVLLKEGWARDDVTLDRMVEQVRDIYTHFFSKFKNYELILPEGYFYDDLDEFITLLEQHF